MTRIHLIAAFAAAFAVFGGADLASAQDDEIAEDYNFDDDVVQGDLVNPDGEMFNIRSRGAQDSLITIRQHFIPEMLKSVEDL